MVSSPRKVNDQNPSMLSVNESTSELDLDETDGSISDSDDSKKKSASDSEDLDDINTISMPPVIKKPSVVSIRKDSSSRKYSMESRKSSLRVIAKPSKPSVTNFALNVRVTENGDETRASRNIQTLTSCAGNTDESKVTSHGTKQHTFDNRFPKIDGLRTKQIKEYSLLAEIGLD